MMCRWSWKLVWVCSIAVVVAVVVTVISQWQAAREGDADSGRAGVLAEFGKLPLYFIENQGQVDQRVGYYLEGKDKSVYFTSDGVVFALTEERKREAKSPFRPASYQTPKPRERWAVELEFVGANPEVQPVGTEPAEATVSYFKGPEENWKTGLTTYASVTYKDVWPGIDLVYAGTNGRLKYTFTVAPEADPGQVRLAYRGASALKLNETGRLEIETPVGGFSEDRPYVYQEIAGQQVEVESAYELKDGVYGFRLGDYDRSRPLVLDPVVLMYAGYIGGSDVDEGDAIAIDGAGNAYVTGWTWSAETSFPVKVGPDLTRNLNEDAFVAKINPTGSALVYAGYIGGAGSEYGLGIAVDVRGNAYIAGDVVFYDGADARSFPAKVGPDLTYNGYWDAFVAKVGATGKTLVYAGYIGGAVDESVGGIAVDSAGNAYVSGVTTSRQATFPVKIGPDRTYNGGDPINFLCGDAFIVKVKADGRALAYAGYIGGSSCDWALGVAVDSRGNAYLTGWTFSQDGSFPVKVGPDLTYNGYLEDAFVAKVNTTGSALVYAGYIGGDGSDGGEGIAVDAAGNAYVTGWTSSDENSFPVKVGPDLTHNGYEDTFVAKVNAAGSGLVYAGYIGGSDREDGHAIAVDTAGNAYVAGVTSSDQSSFPVKAGPDLTYNGWGDAFVAKVNAAGTALLYAGYIGGVLQDGALGIAVDRQGRGNAFVVGATDSDQRSFPVKVGPDLTYNGGGLYGGGDAFVAKVRSR